LNSKIIVVTSGKGGVGKTTVSANIGAALAKTGEKVVVIDTDIGLRNLDVVMGLESRVVFAQDTGGAIKGAIRADLFLGSGAKAMQSAGVLKSELQLWILMPKKEVF